MGSLLILFEELGTACVLVSLSLERSCVSSLLWSFLFFLRACPCVNRVRYRHKDKHNPW